MKGSLLSPRSDSKLRYYQLYLFTLGGKIAFSSVIKIPHELSPQIYNSYRELLKVSWNHPSLSFSAASLRPIPRPDVSRCLYRLKAGCTQLRKTNTSSCFHLCVNKNKCRGDDGTWCNFAWPVIGRLHKLFWFRGTIFGSGGATPFGPCGLPAGECVYVCCHV